MFDKYKNTAAVFAGLRQVNFLLDKTPLGETGCLSNPYFLLTDCIPLSQHSQLDYLWLITPHCAALV